MGNHHLEYGFPSTHSTNSISIALFFYTHVHRLAITSNNQITTLASTSDWTISPTTYWVSSVLLAWYAFSIVFGRLYTAMHSFTDCIMGCVMGAAVWAGYWMMENQIERWLETPGWTGQYPHFHHHLYWSYIHIRNTCSTSHHYSSRTPNGQPTSSPRGWLSLLRRCHRIRLRADGVFVGTMGCRPNRIWWILLSQ